MRAGRCVQQVYQSIAVYLIKRSMALKAMAPDFVLSEAKSPVDNAIILGNALGV